MRTVCVIALTLIARMAGAQSVKPVSDHAIRQAIVDSSIAEYSGNCPCPYNFDRAGRSCGRRSAYSRAGGAAPMCYVTDVTPKMVEDYRKVHQAAERKTAVPVVGQRPSPRETKLRGYVTEVRTSTDFDIEDYRITKANEFTLDFANAGPDVKFSLENIRVGVELEIRGLLDPETSELKATSIRVDLEQFRRLKQTAFVTEALDGITPTRDGGWIGEIHADGQTIQITELSVVVFKPTTRERKLAEEKAKRENRLESTSEFQRLSSLDQVTVGMAMTYEGTRNRDTGKIVAERVEFSNNDLEDGEARLWRSLSPSVRPSQALKPAELRISGVGRFKLLPNDEVQEYIAEVGERLIPAYQRALPANDPRKIPFKFFVVQDEDVNAFALANGTVVVKSGLLEALDNEAQLAAVVGHEIAHSTHEHTWRQEQFHKKKRVGIAIAGAVAAAYGWRDLAELATLVNAAIVNGYGRSLENQADRLGLQYMVAAGYDPREAASVWKLFARKFGDQATDVFWSSHDNHSTRRSYLMNELKNNYRQLDYSQLTAARDRYAVMRSAMVSGKTSKVRIAVTAPVPSSRSASVGPPKPVDVSTVRTVAPSPTPLPAPTLRVDPPKTAVTAIPASALVRTYQPMVERPDLPNIDGLTPAQVKIFLGPPAYTQVLRDKRLAWSYATPDGERTIYFKPESAASQRSKAAASSSSPPTADIAPDACDGVVALTGVRSITVRSPRSPVFSTPQLRQDALRLFAARTVLPVLELDGPWYVVRWQGDRGPQAGYLHCSDATVYALTP